VSDKHNEGFAEVDINTIQFASVDNAIEDQLEWLNQNGKISHRFFGYGIICE
jgi:hypothetical protein